jgi:uncharacterized protein YodC (DUF2158 family)
LKAAPPAAPAPAAHTFAPGDIVQLKSGGVPMVVSGYEADVFDTLPRVRVFWQIQGASRSDLLPPAVLQAYVAPPAK